MFALLEGYNAVVVMIASVTVCRDQARTLPLVLGRSARGSTLASDAIALHDHADELIYLEDDQLAILDAESAVVLSAPRCGGYTGRRFAAGREQNVGLAGYPDFLSKEIAEQPAALRRLVAGRGGNRNVADAIRTAKE